MKNLFLYRVLQLVSLLLGIRFFVLLFLAFALYVSTFFLISQEELSKVVFDIKIHGIIFCSVMSIAAGGLINQFYDQEKDKIVKPFRSQFLRFLKQKYFLYFYLVLNVLSLSISLFLSWRIFCFFLIYQFFIWFYSHKLSKKLLVNNLFYVLLSLYPFFGILVYYQHFSVQILLMAIFLFLLMLKIDVIKDLMTRKGDHILGYQTLPIVLGIEKTRKMIQGLFILNSINALFIILFHKKDINTYYYGLSVIFFVILSFLFRKNNDYLVSGLLKLWVFVGVLCMLFNGVSS